MMIIKKHGGWGVAKKRKRYL